MSQITSIDHFLKPQPEVDLTTRIHYFFLYGRATPVEQTVFLERIGNTKTAT